MMNRNLPASEPFVILEEKKSKKHLIRVLKYIVLTLFFFILVYVTYFSLSYQIISEDVMGLDFKFRELSIISRDHKVSLDQISEGDIIIVSTSFDWSPIIYSYDKYVYKSKKGGLVFAENKNGAIKRLERENVKYAVKMKDG